MKTKKKYTFLFILGIGTILFQFSNLDVVMDQSGNGLNGETEEKNLDDRIVQENPLANPIHSKSEKVVKEEELIITMAVCGVKRINESIVLMKSAIIFSKIRLRFIIFADEIANETLHNAVKLQIQKAALSSRHVFEFRKMQFPAEQGINWKNIFRPCSCQRLFLPSLLPEYDSVLYMDTDSIFLTSPEMIWDYFKQMNSSQIVGMTRVGEIPNAGPYNENYGIPFYGNTGVNAGILLMNLTRLRHFNLEQLSFEYYMKYKSEIRIGDQDILNAMFHYHSEKLYVLPCHYNYRSCHCKTGNTCKEAEENGVYILHTNGMQSHKSTFDYEPPFNAIYETIKNFDLDMSSDMLLYALYYALHNAPENPRMKKARDCKNFNNIFVKALQSAKPS